MKVFVTPSFGNDALRWRALADAAEPSDVGKEVAVARSDGRSAPNGQAPGPAPAASRGRPLAAAVAGPSASGVGDLAVGRGQGPTADALGPWPAAGTPGRQVLARVLGPWPGLPSREPGGDGWWLLAMDGRVWVASAGPGTASWRPGMELWLQGLGWLADGRPVLWAHDASLWRKRPFRKPLGDDRARAPAALRAGSSPGIGQFRGSTSGAPASGTRPQGVDPTPLDGGETWAVGPEDLQGDLGTGRLTEAAVATVPDPEPAAVGKPSQEADQVVRPRREPAGRWRLEVSWTLPRSGPWVWRLEGVGSTVSLALAVAPEMTGPLSEPWVTQRLRGILAKAGLTPAALSIGPWAEAPPAVTPSEEPGAVGGEGLVPPGGFDVRV